MISRFLKGPGTVRSDLSAKASPSGPDAIRVERELLVEISLSRPTQENSAGPLDVRLSQDRLSPSIPLLDKALDHGIYIIEILDLVFRKRLPMSGPIVRTGTTPEFWKNWDNVFGGKKSKTTKAADKAAKPAKAQKAAAKKSSKKK